MNFIFVPTVVTAIIFYVELFFAENTVITQFITYCPQFWTFILPVIYLILSTRKKYQLGIFVNIALILFCASAFLCWTFTENIHLNEDTKSISVDISNYNKNNINLIKIKENKKYVNNFNKIKIDDRINVYIAKGEKINYYYISSAIPYYSSKKDLGENIYKYVTKNSKYAIVFGDFGFPKRGLNYDVLSRKMNDLTKLEQGFKFNDTHFIFKTQNIKVISFTPLDLGLKSYKFTLN